MPRSVPMDDSVMMDSHCHHMAVLGPMNRSFSGPKPAAATPSQAATRSCMLCAG